jgi:ribose 5-phosphate isomerase A
MSHRVVSRKLAALGGQPTLRMKDGQPLVTDNGCYILDVAGLQISNPAQFEATVNNIVGVVTVGLFAQRCADVALLGNSEGVRKLVF